jgi:HPt (histidine-containing phosphotransfer) domain-containing protein
MTGEQVLDQQLVDELLEVMGRDFGTLIESFVRDAEYRLGALDDALAGRDAERVRDLAHGFKGSSSNLGAVALSSCCRRLEQAGREGHVSDADELLNETREAFRRAREALQARHKEHDS